MHIVIISRHSAFELFEFVITVFGESITLVYNSLWLHLLQFFCISYFQSPPMPFFSAINHYPHSYHSYCFHELNAYVIPRGQFSTEPVLILWLLHSSSVSSVVMIFRPGMKSSLRLTKNYPQHAA